MNDITKPEVLAVIQARGGSKAVPYKNIYQLAGFPLIAYSIASANASTRVTRLIISTDDERIASVAKSYGAEVPFFRPPELATDDATDFPLFVHALQWLDKNEGYCPDIIVQLRPTTPFRPIGLIDKATKLIIDNPEADCVRGVTIPSQTPYKMWRVGNNDFIEPLLELDFVEPYNMPRQKLPIVYWQTGHIDVIRSETILQKNLLTGTSVLPVIIDSLYCVDIDTQEDFDLAEYYMSKYPLKIDMPNKQKIKKT